MLYVNLTFERDLAHHLIQVFTPSALIVMLSWLSFWLGVDATAGRITLCVTSLLALITQFSSIRRDLPPLSYIHESNNHVRFSSLKLVPPNQVQTSWQELSLRKRSFYGSPDFPASPMQPLPTYRDWAHTIDKTSRFLFPLAFLLFNTFYWPILLTR
ncbi:hypothetical protein AVEN_102930-1 [Araneus ventricosus]|uniref:Neurotransmitter-gated ion-channel transmembrane domain-containing protein n=1 Tax=Araneus ventricosus TaxID=182803 RepID=A0A4Y2ML24_ARAVE|nr:hypothetical protein AVEN_102930-1 [Araneus ventricosus]